MSTETAQKLAAFCDAIRAKPEWYRKILDTTQDLAEKWVGEAQLRDEEDVDAVLEELKGEARRILTLDFTIRLGFTPPPYHFTEALSAIDADVRQVLQYARGAKHAIRAPELREEVGAFVSDGLVPASLHKELSAALDALADIEPKDFHPGTYGKVQDLIHPSLYPYIADVTPIIETARRPPHNEGTFSTVLVREDRTTYETKYAWLPSVFSISEDGTDVRIASYINGLGSRERFPALYRLIEQAFLMVLPQLERTLEFEFKHQESSSVRRWREREDLRERTTRDQWDERRLTQEREKAAEIAARAEKQAADKAEDEQERRNIGQFAGTDIASSFKGKNLKVIVKAANYCLKPGEAYEGTWHMEGMPHERIVASAIYYYEADEAIVDRGLALRRSRDPDNDFPVVLDVNQDDFDIHFKEADEDSEDEEDSDGSDDYEDDSEGYEEDCPSDWEEVPGDNGNMEPMTFHELSASISLGTVATTSIDGDNKVGTGRILTFPNWIQHKVEGVSNNAPATDGTQDVVSRRKILCFFLVDDTPVKDDEITYPGFTYRGLDGMHVLTTADVPEQARASNLPTLRFLLPVVCRRLTSQDLPQELVERIVLSVNLGVTREEAEATRRAFMVDRRLVSHGALQETYSLCEH